MKGHDCQKTEYDQKKRRKRHWIWVGWWHCTTLLFLCLMVSLAVTSQPEWTGWWFSSAYSPRKSQKRTVFLTLSRCFKLIRRTFKGCFYWVLLPWLIERKPNGGPCRVLSCFVSVTVAMTVKFQDPKEILYHIRPYVLGISPYIGLKIRYLKWPLKRKWRITMLRYNGREHKSVMLRYFKICLDILYDCICIHI